MKFAGKLGAGVGSLSLRKFARKVDTTGPDTGAPAGSKSIRKVSQSMFGRPLVQKLAMVGAGVAVAAGTGLYMKNATNAPVPHAITPLSSGSAMPTVAEGARPPILGASTAPIRANSPSPADGLSEKATIAAGAGLETALEEPIQAALDATIIDPAPTEAIMPAAIEPDLLLASAGDNTSDLPHASGTLDAPQVADQTCRIDIALVAQPGGMIDLGVLAPCYPGQRAVIRHSGLAITGKTSASGAMIASIPAFDSPAMVEVVFGGGASVRETVALPDLGDFDRIGVQWMERDAFQVQAYQFGAAHGEEGHVSAVLPGRPRAEGGFMTLLGDDATDRPLLAEVYTFPRNIRADDDAVMVTIEAAVTDTTCAREILGEALSLQRGRLELADLTMPMPDCDAIGEFMVLYEPMRFAGP